MLSLVLVILSVYVSLTFTVVLVIWESTIKKKKFPLMLDLGKET